MGSPLERRHQDAARSAATSLLQAVAKAEGRSDIPESY